MMDRIDMMIEVPKVKTQEFSSTIDYSKVENSVQIRQRVQQARNIQLKRFAQTSLTSNSEMSSKEVQKYCQLDEA